jgi:solute carrier family 25 carnitine/acylcarnitine transporter 20/29
VLVGHPLDTIKVKIQTMVVEAGKPAPYNGMLRLCCITYYWISFIGALDCARKTMAREGPLGLYKGMLAPLTAVCYLFEVLFRFINRLRRCIHCAFLAMGLERASSPRRTLIRI